MEMRLDKLYCSKEWQVRWRDYSVLKCDFWNQEKTDEI